MKNIFSLSTMVMVAAFVCAPFYALATPEHAPLDGGLSLLVAAGVGYGAKKLAANKKKKTENGI